MEQLTNGRGPRLVGNVFPLITEKVKSNICMCREATIIVGIGGDGPVEERRGVKEKANDLSGPHEPYVSRGTEM